jgi:hypothetical protein
MAENEKWNASLKGTSRGLATMIETKREREGFFTNLIEPFGGVVRVDFDSVSPCP